MNSSLNKRQITKLQSLIDKVCDFTETGDPLTAVDYLQDQSLSSVWHLVNSNFNRFLVKKYAFLWIVEKLISSGRIKLHREGNFLEVDYTREEQLVAFENAWPQSLYGADKIVFMQGSEYIGSGGGMSLWFFMKDCPAEVAWRQADGSYRF